MHSDIKKAFAWAICDSEHFLRLILIVVEVEMENAFKSGSMGVKRKLLDVEIEEIEDLNFNWPLENIFDKILNF